MQHDITSERITEARYRRIFKEADDGMAIVDASSDLILDGNASLERLTGRSLSELARLKVGELFSGEAPLPLEKSSATTTRARLSTASGTFLPVELQISPAGHGSDSYLVTLRDLTSHLREQQIERDLSQVQRLEALGRMASGIAHDFNNTLMAALPWSDVIRKRYPLEKPIQEATAHIQRAVFRASEITRQLLDFAQPKKPSRRDVDLNVMMTTQVKMMRPAIPPQISLSFVKSVEPMVIEGDPGQLSQVVLNLALNARDAMPDGGAITIRVRSPAPEEMRTLNADAEKTTVVEVRDTGSGIDSTHLARIFDPFYTTKDVGQGAGLGLAVVHRIIQQHGGTIQVQSGDEGTTFCIFLPRKGVEQPEARTVLEGKRILVVDDEWPVRDGIGRLLEGEGAAVILADGGLKGLEALNREHVDLVILDYGMPEMSGGQVHAAIRKTRIDLPIIISSGYGEHDKIKVLLRDPATDFVVKPWDLPRLLIAIDRLADRAGATS